MFQSNKMKNNQKHTQCFDGGGDSVTKSVSEYVKSLTGNSMKRKNSDEFEEVEPKKVRRKLVLPSPVSKSLQSQAARKLLDKAKKVIIPDEKKNNNCKKFVLPVRSARSSRVIKPNKKFIQENTDSKAKTEALADRNEAATIKPPAGRVILREARLQLDPAPRGLTEGPFSSPTPKNRTNLVSCGVCGTVQFYKPNKQVTKFGVQSCDMCRKFISKIMKIRTSAVKGSIKCEKGPGLCMVRNSDWSGLKWSSNARCQACWLKLCLKNYLMAEKLKSKLYQLLPTQMRVDHVVKTRKEPSLFSVPDGNISFFDRYDDERPHVLSLLLDTQAISILVSH